MVHAVFPTVVANVDGSFQGRSLIPGVTPGGQFAGKAKPALLINDAWVVPGRAQVVSGADADFSCKVSLKLSQEIGLDPGQLLPVATLVVNRGQGDATGSWAGNLNWQDVFKFQGTIWAPRFVGVDIDVQGGGTYNQLTVDVHLELERIFLAWRDWFVHWELLDGVVDDEEEF